jgi:uncharacterized repeat protein (TIGR03803 family)
MKQPCDSTRILNSRSLSSFSRACFLEILLLVLVFCAFGSTVWAKTKEKVLYSFSGGKDGKYAGANLIFDKNGNLYGVTEEGGLTQNGVVFKLTAAKNQQWTESVIYNFLGGKDGASPAGGLIFGKTGDIYGVTETGGGTGCFSGCGTVFQLAPSKKGKWIETVLYRFTGGADGASPSDTLLLDGNGNLYGTTQEGGDLSCASSGCGTVFQLVPTAGGKWTENVLHAFSGGEDGALPMSRLIFDAAGNLYGTAATVGKNGYGVVFVLAPHGNGKWKETVLHAFGGGHDGAFPAAGLIFDANSSLFGTTYAGGDPTCTDNGCGTVFQLTANTKGDWTETVLHRFHGKDGIETFAIPVFDLAGNLFVTTFEGGSGECAVCGTAVELTHQADGRWKETVLHDFGSYQGDGGTPEGSLVLDGAGNLFGTTFMGGSASVGTVFEITP